MVLAAIRVGGGQPIVIVNKMRSQRKGEHGAIGVHKHRLVIVTAVPGRHGFDSESVLSGKALLKSNGRSSWGTAQLGDRDY